LALKATALWTFLVSLAARLSVGRVSQELIEMSQRQDPRASRLTADASRRKRETEALQLRTRHREEAMVKRRLVDSSVTVTPIANVAEAVRTNFLLT